MPEHRADRTDLELMLLIRHFELMLLRLFTDGKVRGTTHTCLGQEYIPVSLRQCIKRNDFVFSNHRCHGHYLTRFCDPEGLLAEILGKEGAVCNGVGGSQHLYRDNFLSTGIQGEGVGVALGVALHRKRFDKESIVAVYIGDGTWGQGIVYESLNIASLLQLPLLLIVENNRVAQSTPISMNMAGTIEGRVRAFEVEYLAIDDIDIKAIRLLTEPFIEKVRTSRRPGVIEFNTVRLGPHSAGKEWRTDIELENVRKKDWHPIIRSRDVAFFDAVETDIINELNELYKEVERRPSSRPATF